MPYYAGLDVAMKTTFICIVNEKGKVIKELDASSTPEAIHSFISAAGLKIEKVGLESGCLTHYLKKGLKKLGYEVIGMESHKMAAILATIINKTDKNDLKKLFKELKPQDLLKFGIIPEFIGRIPYITTLDPLDEETLEQILTEPKNALVKQYKKLFEMDEVTLEIEEEALNYIVSKALEYKLGARGLRSLCEAILTDAMYELPSSEDKHLQVTKEYAENSLSKNLLQRLKAVS